jgi:hypothetical protein
MAQGNTLAGFRAPENFDHLKKCPSAEKGLKKRSQIVSADLPILGDVCRWQL